MKDSERDSFFGIASERGNDTFRDDILALFARRDQLRDDREKHDLVISGMQKEIKSTAKEYSELEETWNVLRNLLDRFSAQSIGKLSELLNKGVKSIFTDRDYEVKIDISDSKRKQMKIMVYETKSDGDVVINNITDTSGILLSGGGLLVVISFIYQVYLILHHDKRRFMPIDEAFTQISTSYIENFFQFLKYLTTEMGFDFLCINHDPRFQQYFDKTYRVNAGEIKLVK